MTHKSTTKNDVLPKLAAIPGLDVDEHGALVTPQERAEFQAVAEQVDRVRRLAEARLRTFRTD